MGVSFHLSNIRVLYLFYFIFIKKDSVLTIIMKTYLCFLIFVTLFSVNSGRYYQVHQECRDISPNCHYFTKLCLDLTYNNYMRQNCQFSCGFCRQNNNAYNNPRTRIKYGQENNSNRNRAGRRRNNQDRRSDYEEYDKIETSSRNQERRTGSESNRMHSNSGDEKKTQ